MSAPVYNVVTANATHKSYNPFMIRAGDFSPLYISIAICAAILGIIIIINITCYLFKYSHHWHNPDAGSCLLMSLCSATPQEQPDIDLPELVSPDQHCIQMTAAPYQREDIRASYSQPPLTTHREYLKLNRKRQREYLKLHKKTKDDLYN